MYLENNGEVLSKFCLGLEGIVETDRIYAFSGGIRTYLDLLECRDNVQLHLILLVLAAIIEYG